MKKILLLLGILIIGFTNVYATHNRAGEITYKHISGFLYGITVTTYTNTYNTSADRCEVSVLFWHGTQYIDSIVCPRTNGNHFDCPSTADGQQVNSILGTNQYPNTKYNHYYGEFTFPGAGTFQMTMDDPNRNAGTCNINGGSSSDQIAFSLITEVVLNPFLGDNDSPILLNLPLDQACVGVCFTHNPGAYDANGDSLSYSLVPCADTRGTPISTWVYPPNMSANDMDVRRGDLVWCSPNQVCNYNIAIKIKEYRRLSGSTHRFYMGYVIRDMQIEVQSCANNPPVIEHVDDTCIVANTHLQFLVNATDVEFNVVTLEGNGGPFHVTPTATFSSSPTFSPVSGAFNWTPNCAEVQYLPYLVTFKATDSNPNTPLVDYKSVFIRVIAPAPTGVTATPNGSSIIVDWNDAACHDSVGVNPLVGYHIYRSNNCIPFFHSVCETGLPASAGYTLIANTGPNTTIFTDNNNGQGLISGISYSYIIVAYYSDGSQSYASDNACVSLVRDVPIITNVSVLSTGTNDSIWVHWIKPLAGAPNLDTIVYPPPYEYRLMRSPGITGSLSFSQVASYIYPLQFSQITDTGFVDSGINTLDSGYTYRIDFYSNATLVGSTNSASSVFLSSTPAGNQITLSWQAIVPWVNYKYYIYKPNPHGSQNFVLYDSTNTTTYVDTNVVNGQVFCYKVRTVGQFNDPLIPRPLYNMSQIRCETPIDIVPPCQPNFMVENDCGIFQNVISWTNPNTYCCHDAVGYNVYFAPTTDEALVLIYTTNDVSVTSFTHQYLFEGVQSTAGCYAVTAFDSVGNESVIVTKTCVDNCPEYELPNVFTPNGDNINDMVTPLPGYRYVKDIEIRIYDRWGLLMFETNDKDILWDGKNSSTKMMCPDGVYFYVCTVNEIHVDGIIPRELKGFIQLLKEPSGAAR